MMLFRSANRIFSDHPMQRVRDLAAISWPYLKSRAIVRLVAATILICSLVLCAYRMGEPAWENGYHGYILSEYPQNARNYLRWGYLATRLGPVTNPGDQRPAEGFEYRFSHGNVTALLISFSYHLFGINEWSARLPVIGLAALGAVITALLALRLTDSRSIALAAFVFAALNPLQTFYARLPGPHLLATTFVLLVFYSYWRWFEHGGRAWAIQIFVWLAVGTWTDWITYFAVPALLLHFVIFRRPMRRADWAFAAALAAAPVLLFGAYVVWTLLLHPGGIEQLRERFLFRTGNDPSGAYQFTWMEWIGVVSTWTLHWLTLMPVLLALLWGLRFIVSALRRTVGPAEGLVATLFLLGVAHNLAFVNRVVIHDFILLWHLAPAVAIAAAISLRYIFTRASTYSPALGVVAVVCIMALFVDESWLQYRRAHVATTPPYVPPYYVGLALRDLVPPTGRYAALNVHLTVINHAISDRPGDMVLNTAAQAALVRDPSGYDAILVSNSDPPAPEIVRELLARYPYYSVAGHSIFLVGDSAATSQRAFISEATPTNPYHVVFDEHIELLGYDMAPVINRSARPGPLESFLVSAPELLPEYSTTTRLTLYWRKISQRDTPYNLSARLMPLVGPRTVLSAGYAGIEDLLPTTEWPVGQIVRDEFEIRIPADAPDRRYGLWVGVNSGYVTLEPRVLDGTVDSSNRVLVGTTDVRPSEVVSAIPTTERPRNELHKTIVEDLEITGYSTMVTEEGLVVDTYWRRGSGSGDYALSLELEQGIGTAPRATIDIPPPRFWESGVTYRATTQFPSYTPDGDYQLVLVVDDEHGTTTRIPINEVTWCGQEGIQVYLAENGSAGDAPSGNSRVAPDAPLTLEFDLASPTDVQVHVAWTGRAERDRILLHVSAFNPAWQIGSTRKTLATIEARRGQKGSMVVTLPRRLTHVGRNTIELSVPEQAQTGWRSLVAALVPPIAPALAQHPERYQGWVELDTTRVFIQVPKADLSSRLRTLSFDALNNLYEHARLNPGCYDPATIDLLGQEVDAALSQINWDRLSTAEIAELQGRVSRTLPAGLRASLLRRITVPEETVLGDSSGPLIRFLGYNIRPASAAETDSATDTDGLNMTIELYFEPMTTISEDLVIWLHGFPQPGESLPPELYPHGFINLDHWPSTPTSRWQSGQIYVNTYHLTTPLNIGRLELGLYRVEPFEVLVSEGIPEIIVDRSITGAAGRHRIASDTREPINAYL